MTVERKDIVAAARRYLGTPWMHQGRRHGQGVDCAGLLMCVAYDLKMRDVRISDYGRQPDANRARAIIDEHMDRITFAELAPGDVLSFVIVTEIQHFGLVTELDPHRFIHAYQTTGKVIEQTLAGPWLKRLRGCYRFREVA